MMLRSLLDLEQYKIHVETENIGTAIFFVINPNDWQIKFLVIDLNIPKLQKRVLVPTTDIFEAHGRLKLIFLRLTREEVVVSQEFKEDKGIFIEEDTEEVRLRVTSEILDIDLLAKDDKVGYVSDLICDDSQWIVRYFVIDTGNWLPGRKILVSPQWIDTIDWTKQELYSDLSKEQIKNSPEYDPTEPVNLEYEVVLYDYYGKPRYWDI